MMTALQKSGAGRVLKWLLACVSALLLVVLLTGWWLLASSSGLRWLAEQISDASKQQLQFEQLDGRLWDQISIGRVTFDNGQQRLSIRQLQLDWQLSALWDRTIHIHDLQLAELQLVSPASDKPPTLPESLRLPVTLQLDRLAIERVELLSAAGQPPQLVLQAVALALRADQQQLQLISASATSDYGRVQLQGRLATDAPFALQAEGSATTQQRLGDMGMQTVQLQLAANGDLQQLQVALQARVATLHAEATVQLAPLQPFPLQQLQAQLNGLNPHDFVAAAPNALLTLNAQLRGNPDRSLQGQLELYNQQPGRWDQQQLPLQSMVTQAYLSPQRLEFEQLQLLLPAGGTIQGQLSWALARQQGQASLEIQQLDPAALDGRAQSMLLDGNLSLSGDAQRQQGELVLSDGRLNLSGRFEYADSLLLLPEVRLSREPMQLYGSGRYRLDQQQPFEFSGQLQHLDINLFVKQSPVTDLNSELVLQGQLQPQPQGRLQLTIQPSRIEQHRVNGKADIAFNGRQQGDAELELYLGDNRLQAKGSLQGEQRKLDARLQAKDLSQIGYGLAGTLNATASVDNQDWKFTADAAQLQLPGGNHLADLQLKADWLQQRLQLDLQANGYQRQGEPLLQQASMQIDGPLDKHRIQASLQRAKDQQLQLLAQGGLQHWRGNWQQARWQGQLQQLQLTGPIALQLLSPLEMSLQRERVQLGPADFALAGGSLQLAMLSWSPEQWQTQGAFSGLGLRAAVGLKPDLETLAQQQTLLFGGDWSLRGGRELNGKLQIRHQQGDWILPGTQPLALGLTQLQLDAVVDDGALTTELLAVGDYMGVLQASARVPLQRQGVLWGLAEDAPLQGKLEYAIGDLAWLGPVIHSNIKTNGGIRLQAELGGRLNKPQLEGELVSERLSLALLDQNVQLQQGVLQLRIDNSALHIDKLAFQAPLHDPPKDELLGQVSLPASSGTLSASGYIALNGEQADLQFSASHLPLTQTAERWMIVSGQGQAVLRDKKLQLQGKVMADAGLITYQENSSRPQLADDVVLTGAERERTRSQPVDVVLQLDLGEHFYLRAAGLRSRLSGQLDLKGSPGRQLQATGMIFTQDAIFEAYGQRLTVERGIVNFQGPLYDPGLNVLALRKNLEVEAGVEVTGTAQHPEIRLVSTPNVPDADKLSWIVLGRVPDTAGLDSALLIAAAGSILGQGGGGVTSQLKTTLGIDELSLRQADSNDSQADDGDMLSRQIVTIGKRLSARAFLSYEQGVTAAAGVTKLTYSLTPEVQLVTQAGQDNAIDVFYRFRFE